MMREFFCKRTKGRSQVQYEIRRSRRRTLSLEITAEAKVLVRAPLRMSREAIEDFVQRHENWIEQHLQKQIRRQQRRQISPEEKEQLRRRAQEILPEKVERFRKEMGVSPTGVKITSAEHRFGSCNGKNSLCFSLWLMQYPEAAIDYVVVHELAHILHKNHGKNFYACIASYLPDYKEREKLLKYEEEPEHDATEE